MDIKTARIRALNDELRQNLADGIAVMTPGIAALGARGRRPDRQDHRGVRRLLSRQRPARGTRLWRLRSRWPSGLVQDRLLRREPELPLPRSGRSRRHQSRDHDHAGRRVLTTGARSLAGLLRSWFPPNSQDRHGCVTTIKPKTIASVRTSPRGSGEGQGRAMGLGKPG